MGNPPPKLHLSPMIKIINIKKKKNYNWNPVLWLLYDKNNVNEYKWKLYYFNHNLTS